MNALETTQNASIRGGDDDFIKSRIFSIRGVQVMLDCDLAALYGVETKVLNQAVKRVPYAFTNRASPCFRRCCAVTKMGEMFIPSIMQRIHA